MTDNEIIKALECCCDDGCPDNCPLKDAAYVGDCIAIKSKSALDLINSLQAECDNLKDILYDAEGINLVNYWYQQCKIAENGCKNFGEENKKLQAENERLREEREKLLKECKKCGSKHKKEKFKLQKALNQAKDYLIIAKAEARKEFAERLIFKFNNITHSQPCEDIINNLLKEMESE